MAPGNVAADLAAYAAALEYDDLGEGAVEATKTRILDSAACAVGALDEAPVRRVSGYAASKSGDANARLLGDGDASIEYAAFAAAAAVRYLDWNDEYDSGTAGTGHPSGNVGTVLAAADAYGSDGREAILATALAYEIQCRIHDAVSLKGRGIDHTTAGTPAAALAVGRLAGLSEAELADAVRIAVAGHVGLWQSRAGELSEWKGLAFGNAARNAAVAAELAAAGIGGPPRAIEGETGLENLLSAPLDPDTDGFGGRGGSFLVAESNLKPYPVCYHAQGPIRSVVDLRESEGIDPGDVERIVVESFERAVDVTADAGEKWAPETRNTADHSMPYCVARALMDGDVGLEAFEREAYTDPAARDLMARVEVRVDPELDRERGKRGTRPYAVTIETATGEFRVVESYPRGHHERPLSDADFARKVEAAAGDALRGGADDLVAWADGLDRGRDPSELFDLIERG